MTIEEIFSALTEAGNDNRGMEWVKSAGRLYAVYQIFDDRGVPLNTFIWELPASAKWGEGEADPAIRRADGSSFPVPRSAREVDVISTYIDQDIDSRIANNVMRMYANPNGVDVLNEIAAAQNFARASGEEISSLYIPALGFYVDLDGNPVTTREPDWYKQAKEANPFLADWWSAEMLEENFEDVPNPAYQEALAGLTRGDLNYNIENGIVYIYPPKEDGSGFDYLKGIPIPPTLQVQDPLFNTLGAKLRTTQSDMGLFGTVDPDLGENRFFTETEGDKFVAKANQNEEDPDAGLYYLKEVTINGKTYWDMETGTRPAEEAVTTYRRFLVDNFSSPDMAEATARAWAMQKGKRAPHIAHDAYELFGDQGNILGWEVRPVDELADGEFTGANARLRLEAEIKEKNNPNVFVDWRIGANGDKIYFASPTTDKSRKLTPEQIASYQEQGYAVTESLDHPGQGFYTISDSPIADAKTWFGDAAGKAAGTAWLEKNDPNNEHWTLGMQDTGRWGLEEVPDYVGDIYLTEPAANRNTPAGYRTVGHWNADGTQSWGYERIPDEEGPDNFDELVFSVALTQGGAAALVVDAFRDRVNAAQMSFGQAAQLAVQYGKNATQMKNIMKVLLAPPEAFDSTDFDRVMANAGNALAGTPGYSISDAAKQFEFADPRAIPAPLSVYDPYVLPALHPPADAGDIAELAEPTGYFPDLEAGQKVQTLLAGVAPGGGTQTEILSQAPGVGQLTQEMIDAAELGGNTWWQIRERDQEWLDNLSRHTSDAFMAEQWSESKPTVVTPDGTEYENIGEAGEPLKWKKVIAEPELVTAAATSTEPLTTSAATTSAAATETKDVGISKADAFIEALTAGDEWEDKDRFGKYTVGAGQQKG